MSNGGFVPGESEIVLQAGEYVLHHEMAEKLAAEELEEWRKSGVLIDPDCKAGKHSSCTGGICECECHR